MDWIDEQIIKTTIRYLSKLTEDNKQVALGGDKELDYLTLMMLIEHKHQPKHMHFKGAEKYDKYGPL